jgi:hypothetical protein
MHLIDRHLRNSDGLVLRDLNGDGLPDYCTAWEFDQAITIGVHPGYENLDKPWPTARVATVKDSDEAIFTDLDDDGRPDVMYVQGPEADQSGIGISWGPQPDRVLDPEAWTDAGLLPATLPHRKFLVLLEAELNGQPGTEIVAAGTEGTPLVWIEGPAENRRDLSQYRVHEIASVPTNCWTATLLDVDDDGDIDILMAESDSDAETVAATEGVRWLENPGTGTPEQRNPWPAHDITLMEIDRRAELAVSDLDQDGRPDLVFNGRGQIDWWERQTVDPVAWQRVTIPKPADVAPRGMGFAITDLNMDGRLDLVANAVQSPAVQDDQMAIYWMEWLGDEPGADWQYHLIKWGHGKEVPGPGEKWERVRFADVDGDGDEDIIMNEKELWTAPVTEPGQSVIGIVWFENELPQQ